MIHKYNIKGTPEVYTIAINCCSQTGDWEFACSVYDDMTKKGVIPDEVSFILIFVSQLYCVSFMTLSFWLHGSNWTFLLLRFEPVNNGEVSFILIFAGPCIIYAIKFLISRFKLDTSTFEIWSVNSHLII